MLASITPLGQRGRGASWRRTVTAYVIASIAGGALVGVLLGLLGDVAWRSAPPTWALVVVGVAALAVVALDLTGRVTGPRRQVDETWLTQYRDWVVGLGYGFQLGVGGLTIVTSATVYLTWLLEILTARPLTGAAVGGVFGLARALPLLTTRRVVDPDTLRAAHRRWQNAAGPVRRAAAAVAAAAGITLLVLAGT
jgi:sulfite exporter TauE/SafE